jgi:tripartite-type tricarboxylate transporter receptor subunit TctC
MKLFRRFIKVLTIIACGLGSTYAIAQTYPSRPIHLVVPYPAGGGGDGHSRMLAARLSGILGQTIIVENRAGASGVTGSDYVAKAAPDGYTLLFNTNALAVAHVVSKNLPFNVLTDLAPLAMTMVSQNMLVAKPSLPVSNLRELVAYAKANPGKLNYGSSGLATPMLSMELFKSMTGSNILFVPYKGDAPGINDLLGGQIDMFITNVLPLQPHVRAGKVKALGVTSKRRAASLPEVPTFEEGGLAGFAVESWFGLFAPAGTPPAIVKALNAAIVKAVALPEVQQQIAATGGTPASSTPEELMQRIQSDVTMFGQIVSNAGIKVE